MLLSFERIEKSFGTLPVIASATGALERGQKAALVGYNGTGKSTLLRILAGIEEPDGGQVKAARGVRIGYLPQRLDQAAFAGKTLEEAVRERAGKDVPSHSIAAALSALGMGPVPLEASFAELSKGQRAKAAIAGLALGGYDVLLLDEPTNDLDLPALIWLEEYVRSTSAACLIVSHDRRFLDETASSVFELDWSKRTLVSRKGRYSDYLAERELERERDAFLYDAQQEELSRLEALVERKKQEALEGGKWEPSDKDLFSRGFKRDQAKDSARAAKAVEKRLRHIDRLEKPAERRGFGAPIEASGKGGPDAIVLDQLVAGYPNGASIGPVSLEIKMGERVAIIGDNGSGKSTLLQTIVGARKPLSGSARIGTGARLAVLSQSHEELPLSTSAVDYVMEKAGLDQAHAFNLLKKASVGEKAARRPVSELSPGARTRLQLLVFAETGANALVFDEPTNHLDLEALQALEDAVRGYQGTLLAVSHDRSFLEKAGIERWYLARGGALERIGSLDQYVEEKRAAARRSLKSLFTVFA